MLAVLSDIHGNLEALQAVLADANRHGAEAVYCLGDVVGYGPNPCECLDLAQGFRQIVLAIVLFGVWGSVLLGVPPGTPQVSWQGHLFGAVAGLLCAWLVSRADRGPAPLGA